MLRYFDWCIFCMIHSIGAINVCINFEINRYKLTNLESIQKSYVLFDVT